MKKLSRICLAAILVLSMILSLGTVSFAANTGTYDDVISSHVEFVVDGETISAQAFVRSYVTPAKSATLIIASYDASGNLVAADSKSGVNTVLKTNPIALTSGTTVKAYVWEDSNKRIISEIANYSKDFEDVCKGLEITLDGAKLPMSSFNSSYEYTKDYGTEMDVTLPVVKAKIKDNGADVKVENDEKKLKTTITVSYGKRTKTDGFGSVSATEPYAYSRYGKENTRKYVINYKVHTFTKDPGKIYTDDITPGNSGSVVSTEDFNNMYSKAFGSVGTSQNVSFTISSVKRGDVVVIKPTAATYDFDNVVVNENGDKYTVENDTGIGVATVNSTGDGLDWAYENKLVGAISVTIGGTSSTSPLYSNIHEYGYNGIYDTGSRVASTRNPNDGNMMCLGKKNDSAEQVLSQFRGAPYTALPWDNTSGNAVTVSFYVNQPVTVYVLTQGDYSGSLTTDGGWKATSIAGKLTHKYQNYVASKFNGTATDPNDLQTSSLAIAYGLKTGVIKEYNLLGSRTDGQYRIFPHGLAESAKLNNVDVKTTLITATSTIDDILAVLEVPGTSATVSPAGKDIVSNLTIDKDFADARVPSPDVKHFDVDEIYGTGTGSYRMHPDRLTNQVGNLVQYPEVFELYGNEHIRHGIGLVNDNNTYREYWTTTNKPFYTFTVDEDAEIIVFSSGAGYKTSINNAWAEEAAKWNEFAYNQADSLKVYHSSGLLWTTVSIRKATKGETVTIYAPGTNAHMAVIVRPLAK